MKNLHAYFCLRIRRVHGIRHQPMLLHLFCVGELCTHPAFCIWCNPAGDDHPDATAGALREIGRHALKTVFDFFKARVHGPHERAVLDFCKAKIKGGEKDRIFVMCSHINFLSSCATYG